MRQADRSLQEAVTTLSPAVVLREAKQFFSRRNSIYAAFLEKEGPTYAAFRGQGGEEIIVGVRPVDGGTAVTASTYMFDQQVARFIATLPPSPGLTPEAPGDEHLPAPAPAVEGA
jgi:hypothetical protein